MNRHFTKQQIHITSSILDVMVSVAQILRKQCACWLPQPLYTIALALVVLLATAKPSHALQVTSPLPSNDTTLTAIKNARRQIINLLESNKYEHLLQIVEETNKKIDTTSYLAFYPWEVQVLSVLQENTEYFLNISAKSPRTYVTMGFKYDDLGYTGISKILENRERWIEWYESQPLDDEEQQVVRIFLGTIGFYDNNTENKKISKDFLIKYPDSQYAEFVEVRSTLFSSTSWDCHVGYGYISLQGNLRKLTNPTGALLLGTGGFINRFYISVFFLAGSSTILYGQTVTPSTGAQFTIEQGDELRYMNIGAKLGWLGYGGKHIKLYPTFNISSLSINAPPKIDRNKEAHTVNATTGLGVGLNMDFDIISKNHNPKYGKPTASHFGVRLSTNFTKHLASSSNLDGSSLGAEASLVWWIGD